MNGDSLYPLGIALCSILILYKLLKIFVYYSLYKKKNITVSCIVILLCTIGIIFCYIKDNDTYKEVYYLKYTIYYPGNTYTYEVDSCNHVYINSDRGTNYLRYYSIPDKETYGIYTSAPIVINKITKK